MKKDYNLTPSDWYDIACLIDTEFRGNFRTFKSIRRGEYYHLSTNRCDNSSLIRCYIEKHDIVKITRIGYDTETWQEIHPATYFKVNQFLQDNGFKTIKKL